MATSSIRIAMEGQSVVVIHDASREINIRIFEWSLHGLSLVPGDMLTLIAVMHQIITPMGYKSSVDSRLMFGASQKIIQAQAARKKEEYLNKPELDRIFNLYKSEKVGFKIEMATGSSLKAVALKSAMKLKATWLILDRNMKNDEEYFLQKLSCGILRVRRFNKIVRLRGPLHLPQETRPGSTRETYTDSIPLPDTSTEHDSDLFSVESSPNTTNNLMIGQGRDYQRNREQGQRQKSLHDGGYSTPDHLSIEEKGICYKQSECQTKRGQCWPDEEQIQSKHHGKEWNPKPQEKGERSSSSCGGARNFYHGRAEEYKILACKSKSEEIEIGSSFGECETYYLKNCYTSLQLQPTN
ncbi:hypothetical protein CR513_52645, partial [Mucuna pruriens]